MVSGIAEIEDKTQIAAVDLAARLEQFYTVVIGPTHSMMLAKIPAALLGTDRRPFIVAALNLLIGKLTTLPQTG
jgi:putative Ca2+/H+ antiporter (TMEM165/GDT1 family)